ncbi:MAG: hypothetical protein ACXW30_06625 [Micavibrio sp.]
MTSLNPMDLVPGHLQTKYLPKIRDVFGLMAEHSTIADKKVEQFCAKNAGADEEQIATFLASDPEMQDLKHVFLESMEAVHSDFLKDGGNEQQWNILAPHAMYGLDPN